MPLSGGPYPDLSTVLSPPTGGDRRINGQPDLSTVLPISSEGRPSDLGQNTVSRKERGLADEFSMGVSAGIDSLQMSLYGVAALTGREFGSKGLEDFGIRGVTRNQDEAERTKLDSAAAGFTDIEGVGDFFTWAASSLGEAMPSLALAMSGGGAAGLLGKKIVEGSIRKAVTNNIVKRLTAKGFTAEASAASAQRFLATSSGQKMLMNSITKGTKTGLERMVTARNVGAAIGASTAGGVPITGQTDIELQAAGIDAGGTALMAGIVGGALESLGALRLLSKLFPGVDTKVSSAFVKDFAIASGTQMVLEGGTEAAQEMITLAAHAYHDPTFDMFSADNKKRIIDAFAAGAVVGAVTGGGAEIMSSGREGLGKRAVAKAKARSEAAKLTLPTWSLSDKATETKEDTYPEGFEPADNTVYEELRDRVVGSVSSVVEPAVNKLRDGAQKVIDAIDVDMGGGMNAQATKLSTVIKNAHEKFVAQHKKEFARLKGYVNEQSAALYEASQKIADPLAREEYIQRGIASIREGTKAFTDDIKARAAARDSKSEAEVDNMDFEGVLAGMELGGFEQDDQADVEARVAKAEGQQDVEPGEVEGEPTFILGNYQREPTLTSGGQLTVEGYKSEEEANEFLERDVRPKYPSAQQTNEQGDLFYEDGKDPFSVKQQEDGSWVIVGDNKVLGEDHKYNRAVAKSKASARRRNRAVDPAAKERQSPDGKYDMPTLGHAGRNFGAKTTRQGLIEMGGQMIARGDMTNQEFEDMLAHFDKMKNSKDPDIQLDLVVPAFQYKTAAQAKRGMMQMINELKKRGLDKVPFGMFGVRKNEDGTWSWGITDKAAFNYLRKTQAGKAGIILRAMEHDRRQRQLATEKGNIDPDTRGPGRGATEVVSTVVPDRAGGLAPVPSEISVRAEDTTTLLEETPAQGPQRDFAEETGAFPTGDQRSTQNVKLVEETDPDAIDPKKRDPSVETEEEQFRAERSRKRQTAKEKTDAAKIHRDERSDAKLKKTRQIMGRKGRLAVMISDLLVDPDGSKQKAIKDIVSYVQKTLGLANPVVVVDDTGMANLIESGLVNDPIFAETLNDPKVKARNIRFEDISYIYLSDKLLSSPSLTTAALAHELGHQLYRTMWNQLTDSAKLRLYNAFRKTQGKKPLKLLKNAGTVQDFAALEEERGNIHAQLNAILFGADAIQHPDGTVSPNPVWQKEHDKLEARRKELNELLDESPVKTIGNDAAFNEWMADQLAAWTVSRKGPRNAIEAFFHSVGSKLRQLYDFIAKNERFQLNETFAEFTEAMKARAASTTSPGANPLTDELLRTWFKHEGMTGYTFWPHISVDDFNAPALPRIPEARLKELMKQFSNNYPALAKRAEMISKWMRSAFDLAMSPATSVMTRIGETVPIANHLVDVFGRGPMGQRKRASNYHQRLRRFTGQFLETKYGELSEAVNKQVEDEFKGKPNATRKQKEQRAQQIKRDLVKSLRSKEGVANKDATFTEQEQQVRDLFDEMHKYATDNGLPVRHIVNYFPKQISKQKWIENQDKILDYLQDVKGMSLTKARAYYDSLLDPSAKDGRATGDAIQTPGFDNMNSRTQNDEFFDQFLEDDLDMIVGQYVEALTKRVEFNNILGSPAPADNNFTHKQLIEKGLWDPKEKWNNIIAQARAEGATDKQLRQLEAYVEVNLGTYGRDHSLATPKSRKVMANLIAYQNMRVLLYTVFASLPDAGGIIARAGVKNGAMGIAFKSIVAHVREAGKTESGLADMARALGEISSVFNDHVMTEYTDNNYMSPTLKKMNDIYFSATGLNWYTDFTRKLSLAVGIDVILHQAEMAIPGRAKTEKGMFEAQAMLAELGIDAAMVKEWNEAGRPVYGSLGYAETDPNTGKQTGNAKVAEALNQWVSESIMRPDASQRPILSSHPAMQLVYHLKTFTFSIQNTVLRRILHNVQTADGVSQTMQAFAVPVVMMMALTAIGLELRELVKYLGSNRTPATDRMDGMEYVTELWSRAGLNGITQLAWDFEDAESKGRNSFAGALGPTVSQLAELFSKPSTQTIPKTIPIVGQVQGGRDAVRTVISPSARRRRKAQRIRDDMAAGKKVPYLIMSDGIATSVTYGDKRFQEMYEGMTNPLKDGGGFMRVRPTHPLVRRDLREDPDDLKFREKIKFSVADDIENKTIAIAPNNSVAAHE